ncbi:MAG: pyroglutamyl-peptidase I [Candidatus Hodarchaeales archaeon]|jgi:pyroglutamyl-peptidase
MKFLLLTGFEPFGGHKVNPSQIIAEELDGKTISNINITGKTVPLRYKEIKDTIIQFIKDINPIIIINMGQAPNHSISFERIAINIAETASTYNCGSKPQGETLEEDGPAAYFSNLPLKQLVQCLHQNGIPSNISNSAGSFGCNQLFYHTMHFLATNSPKVRPSIAGFIHLPLLPEQVLNSPQSSSMDLQLMKEAITLVIKYLSEKA